jgi:hypothetical protein
MNRLSPEDVRTLSGPLAEQLHAEYYALLKAKGPTFAAVALFDACSTVLGVALLPFNPAARLQALELLRSKIEEAASEYRAQFNAFREKQGVAS